MKNYTPSDYKKELVTELKKFPVTPVLMGPNSTTTPYLYQYTHEMFNITFARVSDKTYLFSDTLVKISHEEAFNWIKTEYQKGLLFGLSEDKIYWYILLKNIPVRFPTYSKTEEITHFAGFHQTISKIFTHNEVILAIEKANSFDEAVLLLATGLDEAIVEVIPSEWMIAFIR